MKSFNPNRSRSYSPPPVSHKPEVSQEWRDESGRVDLDAVRERRFHIDFRTEIIDALCDEVEELRPREAELAALRLKCDAWADELAEVRAMLRMIGGYEPLGKCSREGCDRPAIEAKPGYIGPLYCSPVHAFTDPARRGGA